MPKIEGLAEAIGKRAKAAWNTVGEVGDGVVAAATAPRGEIRERARAAYHDEKTKHLNEKVMRQVKERWREEMQAVKEADDGEQEQPAAPEHDPLTTWREYFVMSESLLAGAEEAVTSLKNLADQIGALRKYEFVFETLVGPHVLKGFVVIEASAKILKNSSNSFAKEVADLQSTPSATIVNDDAVAREKLERFRKAIEKQRRSLEVASTTMTDAARSINLTVVDKAVEAIVASETTPIGVIAGFADTLASISLDLASEVKYPEAVAAVSAVQSFKPVATHIIQACYLAMKKKGYRSSKGSANVFTDSSFQPLTFARMLIDKQKRLVREVLDGLSFVTSWAPIFASVVKPIIVTVVTDLLEARYIRAEAELKKNAAKVTMDDVENVLFGASGDTAEDYAAMLTNATARATDLAKNVLHQSLTAGVSGVSGGGVNAVRILLGFLDPLIARLFALLPIKPAQAVSAEDLSGSLEAVFANSAMGGAQELAAGGEEAEYVLPTQTRDGNEIVAVLSREKGEEDGKEFLWARVRGEEDAVETGRLFIGVWNFVAVAEEDLPADFDGLPGTTNKDIEIAEFKGTRDVDGVALPFCRVRNLWGTIDADRGFTPLEPVVSGAAGPWRERIVNRSGYKDEQGQQVDGTWYIPFADRSHSYLFVATGERAGEWVHGSTKTKGGPGFSGNHYTLETKLKNAVAIGVRPDSWTEDYG